MKKFDFCIGNPPYQDSTSVNNRESPVYPHFYDAAEKIADKYSLISPARFLFNTGLTPKEWNKKMLSNKHLKVIKFEQDATKIFPNTEIKGGVAIMYYDTMSNFGTIGEFIPDGQIKNIASKFENNPKSNLSSIVYSGRSDLKFTNKFLEKYPNSVKDRLLAIQKTHPNVQTLSPNEEFELKSSTFDVLPYAFENEEPTDSNHYKILGLKDAKRAFKWIPKQYMVPRYPEDNNVNYWKVFLPESNGAGFFGDVLSSPLVAGPGVSSTPTFISIGKFSSKKDAENLLKYTKTKFSRALLSILKKTQHNPASVWAYIPLQDFSKSSDIDWSKSIAEIDQQLYKKYGLSPEEIEFIETKVKEMV